MARSTRTLSKSGFLRGWQCAKSLYLSAFESDLLAPPDPEAAARMDVGRKIGLLARGLFPGGESAWSHHPFDLEAAVERTRTLVAGRAPAIYEAALATPTGLRAVVDVLARGRRGWRLIEVKSSTSVKEEHLPDVAFQLYVARGDGLEIEAVEILHLNGQYMRRGPLDLSALFTLKGVTAEAEELGPAVAAGAADFLRLLRSGHRPDIAIGPHCLQPRECDCRMSCWADVPGGSVLEIAHLSWEKKFHLFDAGTRLMRDVPDDLQLPQRSRRHVAAVQGGHPIIDKSALRAFLEGLAFPVFLVDFETVGPAAPLWDGTRPYDRVPFQYSLHILRDRRSEPEHTGFLAEPGPDPRPTLLASLLEATEGEGSILAYHMPFERDVMKRLAEAFPAARPAIEQRLPRMDDLIRPFRAWHYWLPEMGGSFSIKSVAPALAPDLRYDDLEVADGQQASLTYEALLAGLPADVAERKLAALGAYCARDTLAMVRVLQAIWQAAK